MKSARHSSAHLDAALALRAQAIVSARSRIELVRKRGRNPYQSALWRMLGRGFERALSPSPTFSFLQRAPFQSMHPNMPVSPILANLGRGPLARLPELLLEDAVGEVHGLVISRLTSMNQLHQLNDLSWFCGSTNCRWDAIGTIVEWGGGYGCMAKLLRRLRPGMTHIIIDLPLISCVQWLYLASIFGEDAVHQIRAEDDVIRPGRINLLPLAFLERRAGLRADLFLSTFALNESSEYAQDFVISRDWFSARHLPVACNDRVSDARKVTAAAARRGARLEQGAHPRDTYAMM